jgi:hypothetical protein
MTLYKNLTKSLLSEKKLTDQVISKSLRFIKEKIMILSQK